MDTFGEWLQQQRKHRQLTREGFAQRVGCSVAMLRKIEHGERRPSAQIAELIANALEIPPGEHKTFVRVARGELKAERISHLSNLLQDPHISSAQRTATSRNNLPILPGPFIGRVHELNQLDRFLRDPHCSLLTLVGPGGIGKTRLAMEAASKMENQFEDGIYCVPLAPVNSGRFIIPVMADSIGFTFQSANPVDPKSQLFCYLKEKNMLLLIDNIEHLLKEPEIDLFPELLAVAPSMKLLFTSREPLNLQDEWIFEVRGLPVPKDPQNETIAQGTSIELFIQRACRAHAELRAGNDDLSAIAHICQLVDGMPLGIELAAAWARTLSCDEIAREIERGLGFLSTAVRDIPARHRSMQAVFDHSWKLLTEEEQQALVRLSVFQGGFRREAAEQVAGAHLALLSSLVSKSLVRRSGAGRYDLHELIRQYAAERLAGHAKETTATQARHGSYYLAFFSSADERLRSSRLREALSELTAEMGNFRAAWDWAIRHREFTLVEQTARTAFMLYDTLGWFQEGLDSLGRAVGALEADGQPPTDRAERIALGHILATRAWFAYRLSYTGQAQAMLERSLEILRPMSEPRALVESLAYLGIVTEAHGSYARALELYSEGLEIARATGDRWYAALCMTQHTALAGFKHGLVEAEITHERLQSIVAEWRLIGDPSLIAHALNYLSQSAMGLHRYDEARAALEENLTLDSSIGFGTGLGFAQRGLGIVAQAQGQHQQAVEMFRKSLDIYKELGVSLGAARVLADMGRSMLALGDEAEAERTLHGALQLATDIHATPVALEALAGLAGLLAKRGDREQALELLWILLNHPASYQETKNRANDLQAELAGQLSASQCKAIQAHAGAKTFEAVVSDLLK